MGGDSSMIQDLDWLTDQLKKWEESEPSKLRTRMIEDYECRIYSLTLPGSWKLLSKHDLKMNRNPAYKYIIE